MALGRVSGLCWLIGMVVACGNPEPSAIVEVDSQETTPFENQQYVPPLEDSAEPPRESDGQAPEDASEAVWDGEGELEEPDGAEDALLAPDVVEDAQPAPDVVEDVQAEAEIQQEDAPSPEPDSTESQ
jgi:hypothetical protein